MQLKRFAFAVALFSLTFLVSNLSIAQRTPQPRSNPATKKVVAHTPGPLGMDADSHFERVLANSQVRVFRLTIAPSEATQFNSHPHDYLVVSLGSNQVEAVGDIDRFPMEMTDGTTQVLTGGWPHRLVNKAAQPAHLLVLEVVHGISPRQSVCGLGSQLCNQARFGNTVDGTYSQTMLFETSTVRLLRAELGPGGVLPGHTDASDHLIVSLNTARLRNGLDPATELSAGDAAWAPGRLGALKNLGTQEAQMLILELK